MNHVIDLRSDTVTRPTPAMRKAMADAEVGDDVYGDDPTMNRLQAMAAERLGFEATLFAASGTQANLIGLMAHCERGDEYIVGQLAHTYRTEGGGAAVLGSIQPQPIEHNADGSLDLGRVRAAVKPVGNIHNAQSKLLCLENTISGKVLPMDYLVKARALAEECNLAMHLDGARVFNAAIKLGVDVTAITRYFDSVAFCLSKSLGAPVGSLICGSQAFIERCRRWRKVTGGGMRQVGILAAAGIVALEQHVERLAEDHANAEALAHGLAGLPGLRVDLDAVQTNMVFIEMDEAASQALASQLKNDGILIRPATRARLVTHLDVSSADVARVVERFQHHLSHEHRVRA